MHLVLMRHPEREKNVPEINARLTPQGLNSAQQTAVEIAAEIKSFDLLLRSDVEASKQAAEKLMGLLEIANVGVPAVLAPNRQNITLADIELEWLTKPYHSVAIIGHHPGITRLLKDLTGKPCRTIDRGEAVWIEMEKGRGYVRRTFGSTYSSELLRKKVELKMTVSTFLAGFTIPVLVEMVKDRKEGFTPFQMLATILFTVAFCLFALAVFMYDELLMPNEYWGPVDSKRQPKRASRSDFAHNYRLNGRMYAYMVRTWSLFFTPGVVFTAFGFISLILGKWPGENVGWVLLVSVLALLACPLAHWLWHPRLGVED